MATTTVLALGTGCQHAASAAGSSAAPAPPPFASPPVLPGTPDVATLVSRVRPAVVNITTVHEVRVPHFDFGFPDFENLLPFFGHGGGGPGPGGFGQGGDTAKQQALGSGFIIDAQGHVVTNAHVVRGADMVKVKLADDREYQAKVVGKDDRLDVAVLALEGAPKNLPVASLGESQALRVGDYVVAIGNPFGLGNTVTMGIVSAKGRSIGAGPYDDFIQTDASINPGNSGGPLFDLHGQVVGINTAINPQGRGIGFAIPMDAVKDVLPQLLANGYVARGRLGVVIQGMDEDLAKALGMDRPHGALVGRVEVGSPAEKAGIKDGDVIVSVDGHDVPRSEDLPRMIAAHRPGTHAQLVVVRNGQSRPFDVVLAPLQDASDRPSTQSPDSGLGRGERAPALGISVADEDGHAVVARVAPDGPASGKLREGDVIEEIDHQAVTRASDVAAKIGAARADQPVLIRIKRGDEDRYVAVTTR
ncbi:MAG: Do family serine endopeptidase [Polyangiaceae bacterium]